MERASIELISAGGLDAANVQEIAKRAKSSVGAFYSRFDGKDDLITHLHRRLWADVGERWDEAMGLEEPAPDGAAPEDPGSDGPAPDAGDLPSTLQRVATGLFHAFESDARARRLVGAMREAASDDRPSREVLLHLRSTAASAILARPDDLARPDSRAAVDVLLRAWIAAIQDFADEANAPDDRPPRETLAGELVAMAESYLAGRSGSDAPPEAPEGMEFFDVWG